MRGYITFNGNGGTGHNPITKNVASNTSIGTLPSNPSKIGYTFNGWFTAISGGSQITTGTIVTGAVIYYAQWTPTLTCLYNPGFDGSYYAIYPSSGVVSTIYSGIFNCDGPANSPGYCNNRLIGDYIYTKGSFQYHTDMFGGIDYYEECAIPSTPRTGGVSGVGCFFCPSGTYVYSGAGGTLTFCNYGTYNESNINNEGWRLDFRGALCNITGASSGNGNYNWSMR